jgi:hypothetical protein
MMAGNRGANPLSAPAVFGLIDSSEARLILKHEPHFSTLSTAIVHFFL